MFTQTFNMLLRKVFKYSCCAIDITIGCRIIGFFGIAISIMLITVLLNDKYINRNKNYDISRKTALALGLDWQHFHSQASTAHVDDPDGKMISIIVVFYAVAFLAINLLLFFATIKRNRRCTVPWLVCEIFGCLSKFGALMFHLHADPQNLSATFIVGSAAYIVIILWWWIVVFSAQLSWRNNTKATLSFEMSVISPAGPKKSRDSGGTVSGSNLYAKRNEKFDSPLPYFPNSMYALI